MAKFHTIIEKIDSMLTHHLLYCIEIREEYFNLDPVLHIGAINDIVSLRELASRIQCENSSLLVYFADHVSEDLILIAQTRRQSCSPIEILQKKLKCVLRLLINEPGIDGSSESYFLIGSHRGK